jgi:hypothetical protein
VYGAHKQASSADKAAKSQESAAREALAWEKEQKAAEDARLAPYRQMGGNAMAALGQKLGVPGYEQGRTFGSGPLAGAGDVAMTLGQMRAGGLAKPEKAAPGGMTIGQMRGGIGNHIASVGGGTASAGSVGGGLVPLTAPDGSTRMVTPEKAAMYRQRWAQMNQGGAQPAQAEMV